jgi:SAM-dependent methyltransferase
MNAAPAQAHPLTPLLLLLLLLLSALVLLARSNSLPCDCTSVSAPAHARSPSPHPTPSSAPQPKAPALSQNEWANGVDFEVGFWRSWVETKGAAWPEDYAARLSRSTPMRADVVGNERLAKRFSDSEDTRVLVLDCGAGPITGLGYLWGKRQVSITAVDALAKEYSAVLRDAHLLPPIWTQYAPVETLTSHFAVDFFDLVTMRNALDHTADPIRGIAEMLTVAKPGAPLYLAHARNVADAEHRIGFHQWNIDCLDDGRFVVSKGGGSESIDVGDRFKTEAQVECLIVDGFVNAWLWKKGAENSR